MFFVTCAFPTLRIKEATVETEPSQSFEDICDGIWTGQYEDVVRVFSFDDATGVGSAVTGKVAKALAERSHKELDEPHYEVAAFCEHHGAEPYRRPRTAAERRWDEARDCRDLAA